MSGLVVAEFTPTTLPVILWKEQIPGGMEGIEKVASDESISVLDVTVCERFRMTPLARTAEQVEALRCEGAVYAWCKPVVWQYNDQLLIGGMHDGPTREKRAAANKRAADNVLQELGLWTTGKQVGYKDANDVNSAAKHLIAYLRNIGHEPTLGALNDLVR